MLNNKELLQSVLRHYTTDTFDPDRAVERFRERTGQEMAGKRHRGAWRWALVVASVAVVVVGLALRQQAEDRWEMIVAPVAELPDGTIVQLREGASLAYQPRCFARERTVRLSGTGYFDVVHNPDAPFDVHTEEAFVRVLGTRFIFDAEHEEVFVIEGRVQFARTSSSDGLVLAPGDHAMLPDGTEEPVLTDSTQPNPAAWATGRLAYESVPLGTVLEELTALYGQQLSVVPETAIGKQLTGDFMVDDGLDFIVAAIEAAMDVQIVKSGE